MDRQVEEKHLRKAEARIAQGRERVECQVQLIARLTAGRHDVTTAKSLLQTMHNALAAMEEHRRLILKELAD
jgi:hypothetical protein